MKKIINSYFDNFKNGKKNNYYLDKKRYNANDTWASKDTWVKIAKECIANNQNILQALEILIIEEYNEYYSIADKVLIDWYNGGPNDIEYYHDILAFMPKDYSIRQEMVGDYSDYLVNYSVGSDTLMRESLIRSKDVEFCKIYGKYLDVEIEKYKDNFEELSLMMDANYIYDLGKDAYKYIGKENLDIVKNMLIKYIQKDKEMALKILNGYVPNIEEEQTLWIIDHAPKVAFYMGWNDILEYLADEAWYWDLLFDSRCIYEDYENTNLLIWSNYTCNNTLKERAYVLMENRLSYMKLDGVIALTRMRCNEKL